MPVENDPQFPSDLNPAWPLEGDVVGEGDDHLRGIKQVVVNLGEDGGAALVGNAAIQFDSVADMLAADWCQDLPDGSVITTHAYNAPVTSNWTKLAADPASGFVLAGVGCFLQLASDDGDIRHLGGYDGGDISAQVQWAFNNSHKLNFSGSYICSNVIIPDNYVEIIGNPILNAGSSTRVMSQDRKSETLTTLQADINIGDLSCSLADINIPIGAIVRLQSNKHISRKWTNLEVRPSYQEGEINKVISKSGNIYTFETGFYFDYEASDMLYAGWYTPRNGCRIEATLLNDTNLVFSGNTGLELWHQDNNVNLDIITERFNSQGVLLGQCWKPNIKKVDSIGGNDGSGKNYGLNIADGTRFASADLVRGEDTRHSITVGGEGRAIPLQGVVSKAFNTNTNKTSVAIPGIDMHGNSAGFIFGQCVTDTTVTISGLNNTVESVQAGDGWFAGGSEGGFNVYIKSINAINPYRFSSSSFPYVGLKFDDIHIRYTKIVPSFETNLNASGDTTIVNYTVINEPVNNATSDADANTKVQPGTMAVRANTTITNANFSGFDYIRMVGGNIRIKQMTVDNCGWDTADIIRQSAIWFTVDSDDNYIGQVVSKASNPNLTYSGRLIGFDNANNFNNITIMNLSGVSRPRVLDAGPAVLNLRLINNTLTGISSVADVNARIWGWDGLADN